MFTPTECFAALKAGATGLKFFPGLADRPGRAFRHQGRSAQGRAALCGRRGRSANNFGEWLKAGATGFGIGTALYRPGQTVGRNGRRAGEDCRGLRCGRGGLILPDRLLPLWPAGGFPQRSFVYAKVLSASLGSMKRKAMLRALWNRMSAIHSPSLP
ncbi:MAG: hypothetical protein QM711_12735 [Micropruina sp.]|uniref:hypothetical protein n=1 Tax=Micropruina sp. TaxID=2737536 RepID=UPI0039E2CBD6